MHNRLLKAVHGPDNNAFRPPGQRQAAGRLNRRGHSDDRNPGAFACSEVSRGARRRETANRLDVSCLGNLTCRSHNSVGNRLALRRARGFHNLCVGRVSLHLFGHVVHRGHSLNRVIASGRFRRQHDRIRTFVNGGGDVRHLGARWHWRLDHRFQHLRCNNHRLGCSPAAAHQALLNGWHVLYRQFHTQVTARNHDAI